MPAAVHTSRHLRTSTPCACQVWVQHRERGCVGKASAQMRRSDPPVHPVIRCTTAEAQQLQHADGPGRVQRDERPDQALGPCLQMWTCASPPRPPHVDGHVPPRGGGEERCPALLALDATSAAPTLWHPRFCKCERDRIVLLCAPGESLRGPHTPSNSPPSPRCHLRHFWLGSLPGDAAPRSCMPACCVCASVTAWQVAAGRVAPTSLLPAGLHAPHA